MDDNLSGRLPNWKITVMENGLRKREPKEDDFKLLTISI